MSKTYIGQIVEEVNRAFERQGPVLAYGENIDTGSRISGLARGIVNPSGRILNVGNCELTHVGMGLGMMMDGGKAVLFMKQLDFLLLGLDQIVNTFNSIRAFGPKSDSGSFTIFLIVCDQGYQGTQSSLNSASDIASLANVDVYCLNGAGDATRVIEDQFVAPGFRIVCTSQRQFQAQAIDIAVEARSKDDALFRYRSGRDATIACYNFSLRDGIAVAERLKANGYGCDLFHVNFVPDGNLDLLVESCRQTRSLILIDDSKAVLKFGDQLVARLQSERIPVDALLLTRRGCAGPDYGVAEDQLVIDPDEVLTFVGRERAWTPTN